MSVTRVSVELNNDILAQIIAELELGNAPSFTLNHSGRYPTGGHSGPKDAIVRGVYHPGSNHVDITSQGESYEREGLYVLTKHIRFTVLHELRHAWQREHWTAEQQTLAALGPYELRQEEIDANKWADYAMPKYTGLVTIKRTQIGRKRLPG